jgi:CubicO group peptidase (beta-lactamase class C family)
MFKTQRRAPPTILSLRSRSLLRGGKKILVSIRFICVTHTVISGVAPFALRVVLVAWVASAAVLAGPSPDSQSKPNFSKVRKSIEERINRIPSIAVAVARKGEVLWEEGFGWADRTNRIPATEHTMYYTASVTKSFTATALMILCERKKVDLDRPVNDYLTGAKLSSPAWNASEATVRRVVNHTAGLTTFNASSLSREDMIRRYGVLFWPPGEHFDYSNLGPKVIEEVIANVSGQSYSEFMRSEVFGPLGITEASVGFDPAMEKYTARAYNPVTGLRPPSSGGIYCSVHDVLRFGMFHLKTRAPGQKAILSDRSIYAMQNETVKADGGSRYGLAWWIEEDRFGFRSILAQGGTDTAQAWLRLIPSEGIAVALLCNSGNSSVKAVVDEILSTLLPVYAEKLAQAAAVTEAPKTVQLPSQPFVGSWKGAIKTFRGDIPLTFSIAESGEVQVQLGSQAVTVLDKPKFNEKRLFGTISGKLGIEEDGIAQANQVEFSLYLRDGALKGAAVTRPHPCLPYWAELKRESHLPGR